MGIIAEFEWSLISSKTKEAFARVKAEGEKTWEAKGNAEVYTEAGYVKGETARDIG